MDLPRRVHGLASAQARFGPLVPRVLPRLRDTDPLADAAVEALADLPAAEAEGLIARGLLGGAPAVARAPEALRALLEQAWSVPAWVDREVSDRAGRLLFRSGMAGGMVLGTKSLVLGYASPGGNKPLVLSGRLSRPEYAGKRLAETAKFVMAVAEPGGLEPGALGHRITLRVRLMHAKVRALALRSGQWRAEDWGAPINQHDMLATILVFSSAFVEGVQQLGISVSPGEAEDYTHLWNRVAHIIGVQRDLHPTSAAQALELAHLIESTQGEPDDDARQLVRSYFEAPLAGAKTAEARRAARRQVAIGRALARHLLGPERSTQLELHDAGWSALPRTVRAVLGGAERARRHSPPLEALAIKLGRAHWSRAVRLGLAGGVADFALPDRLLGLREPRRAA